MYCGHPMRTCGFQAASNSQDQRARPLFFSGAMRLGSRISAEQTRSMADIYCVETASRSGGRSLADGPVAILSAAPAVRRAGATSRLLKRRRVSCNLPDNRNHRHSRERVGVSGENPPRAWVRMRKYPLQLGVVMAGLVWGFWCQGVRCLSALGHKRRRVCDVPLISIFVVGCGACGYVGEGEHFPALRACSGSGGSAAGRRSRSSTYPQAVSGIL
jgi:hypothetical protein